jgi:hypothetical protein
MVQAPTAVTVTVNMQVAELPAQSQAVQVTVVVPTVKVEPDGGVQEVTPGMHIPLGVAGRGAQLIGQLSVTVGGG